MREVSKYAPQFALRDLDEAYKNFFRRVKSHETPGFPKLKSKHKTKPSFSFIDKWSIRNGNINIPRIGRIKLKENGYLPNKENKNYRPIKATVKGTGSGKWFVSVLYEVEAPNIIKTEPIRTVGIDLGLKTFAVTSDGDRIEHPKFLNKCERRLKRLQKKIYSKVKGSNNRKKAVKNLNAQFFKLTCKRKDFLHKLTTNLVKTKPEAKFVVEGLNIQNMMGNHKLAKAINDSCWGEFTRQLDYKSTWAYGISRVVKADRWFPSSKMCSNCGSIKPNLTLKDRTYACPSCSLSIDRDLNAAINLSKYELPQVLGEVKPVENVGCQLPPRSRKKALTQVLELACVG
jgi:putative transposase